MSSMRRSTRRGAPTDLAIKRKATALLVKSLQEKYAPNPANSGARSLIASEVQEYMKGVRSVPSKNDVSILETALSKKVHMYTCMNPLSSRPGTSSSRSRALSRSGSRIMDSRPGTSSSRRPMSRSGASASSPALGSARSGFGPGPETSDEMNTTMGQPNTRLAFMYCIMKEEEAKRDEKLKQRQIQEDITKSLVVQREEHEARRRQEQLEDEALVRLNLQKTKEFEDEQVKKEAALKKKLVAEFKETEARAVREEAEKKRRKQIARERELREIKAAVKEEEAKKKAKIEALAEARRKEALMLLDEARRAEIEKEERMRNAAAGEDPLAEERVQKALLERSQREVAARKARVAAVVAKQERCAKITHDKWGRQVDAKLKKLDAIEEKNIKKRIEWEMKDLEARKAKDARIERQREEGLRKQIAEIEKRREVERKMAADDVAELERMIHEEKARKEARERAEKEKTYKQRKELEAQLKTLPPERKKAGQRGWVPDDFTRDTMAEIMSKPGMLEKVVERVRGIPIPNVGPTPAAM